MIFVDFVVLRENFWFLPPKIRSRRHVGAGWFLTTALVGMLLSQNTVFGFTHSMLDSGNTANSS